MAETPPEAAKNQLVDYLLISRLVSLSCGSIIESKSNGPIYSISQIGINRSSAFDNDTGIATLSSTPGSLDEPVDVETDHARFLIRHEPHNRAGILGLIR